MPAGELPSFDVDAALAALEDETCEASKQMKQDGKQKSKHNKPTIHLQGHCL